MKTNPNAILTCLKNSIFTNVEETGDGGFYWEDLEDETPPGTEIISWTDERYKLGEDKTKKPVIETRDSVVRLDNVQLQMENGKIQKVFNIHILD
jgi:GTP-dependent phosphoenolpyruvate carboxykinase